jgi:hypothetical protein
MRIERGFPPSKGAAVAARSIRVNFVNKTRIPEALVLTEHELEHGRWVFKPSDFVGDGDFWESESNGFLTGTEGRVKYLVRTADLRTKLELHLHWNNPFVGDNSYDATVRPRGDVDPDGFSVGYFGPTRGDNNAEVTFVVLSGNCSINEDTGEIACTSAGASTGPQGWQHGLPAAGHVKVAPDTSPTSWYTTPENVQHIAYVGTDQQIHECFFRIGGTRGWEHNVPSAGRVPVAPGTSPTSWYTTPENLQHIAYVGTDQQIHECFFRIGGTRGWEHNLPSAGRELVAPGTSPTSWYTTPENVQHIGYVGADQQIHQCFFFIGGFGGWRHEIPSAGHVAVAAGTSPTSWYTTPEKVQHIAYVGTDGKIHECFMFIRVGGDHVWLHGGPGVGQANVAPGTSPTSWYTTPENVQHIAYVGTDQQIHELFFFIR